MQVGPGAAGGRVENGGLGAAGIVIAEDQEDRRRRRPKLLAQAQEARREIVADEVLAAEGQRPEARGRGQQVAAQEDGIRPLGERGREEPLVALDAAVQVRCEKAEQRPASRLRAAGRLYTQPRARQASATRWMAIM